MPEQTKLTVTVTSDEAEAIKAAASQRGVSVSQYLHAKVFEKHSPPLSAPGDGVEWMSKFEALLRQAIYLANRVHVVSFALAEAVGTLTVDQLQKVYDESAEEADRYVTQELPKRIATLQAQLAAEATKPAAANETQQKE